MKFNKMMTKVLSALIMVSMVGTSVQVPTLAEVTNAGRAIVAGTVEDKAKDASGSCLEIQHLPFRKESRTEKN